MKHATYEVIYPLIQILIHGRRDSWGYSHLVQATGKIKTRPFTLIATNQRIILAQFSAPLMQEALVQSKSRAKGFMGKLLAGRVLLAPDVIEFCRRYFSMSPDIIVMETPGNIALNSEGINRIYVDYELDEKDEDSSIRTDRYWLKIESNQGDHKFVFDADPQDIEVLKKAIGDKVHGEGRKKPLKPNF